MVIALEAHKLTKALRSKPLFDGEPASVCIDGLDIVIKDEQRSIVNN